MKIKTFLTISFFAMANASCSQQDWADLNHYRNANQSLKEDPASGKNKVILMGDSIIEYWLTCDHSFFSDNPYSDRGISGQTTPQMLLRFRQDVIELKPEVVVILGGTNDISGSTGPSTLDMIMDNIASMADLAKANHIKVVLCSVLPAFHYPWKFNVEPAEKIVALNKLIEAYAKANDLTYVDFHSVMKTSQNGMKQEYSNDGVHPNPTGYMVMKPLVQQAIAATLAKK